MTRTLAALLALAAFQADDEKLKPGQFLTKVQGLWAKKKGCHLAMDVTSALLSAEPKIEKAEFEGKLIRDFMAVRGSAELYGRGTEKLIRQDKEFVEPRKATGRVNRVGSLSRNPSLVAAELFRFQAPATFGASGSNGS